MIIIKYLSISYWQFRTILLILISLSGLLPAQGRERPNIILIMADDLGPGDLGVYGQQLIKTPNIDALAKSGIRFTNFYSGSTVCAPSREAMLTGKHTGHTFIRGNFLTDEKEDPAMPSNKFTIAEKLKESGYYTGLIGKWGLGGEGNGPETQGFDYSYGYLDQIQAHNYYPPFLYENGNKVVLKENENGREGVYSHHLFIEKTVDFLDNKSDQPFFLYLPYTIPHGKHVIPDNEPYAQRDWKEQFKNYAAMISQLDADIGKLVDLLKRKGIDDNTIIFFTSDNGANPAFAEFFKSNGSFKGHKRLLYEGGIRAPLIVNWPARIKSGRVSDRIMASWDLFPTICEIAGATIPEDLDGISSYPTIVNGRGQKEHPYLYWEYYTYNYNWDKPESKEPRNWLDARAVRMGKWKAVSKSFPDRDDFTIELYDLSKDPGEERDLAETNPSIIQKVKEIFLEASTDNAPFFPYKQANKVGQEKSIHRIQMESPADLKNFFKYTPDRIPLVSAHRGGPRVGFPENCLETFENTLAHTPAILEIDPHYTKDGEIVLMHDPTLDRTTNGTGKVADFTLAELRTLRLKDTEGNVTDYRIPTLDEALQWARGKTILVIDAKDVPIEERAKKIIENNAESYAILIAYSMEDIEKTYNLSKDLMMEIMMGKMSNVTTIDNSGIPWENFVPFVSHDLPQNQEIYQVVHERGAMCIQGTSRNVDKQFMRNEISKSELLEKYKKMVRNGADILEVDLGIEAGEALQYFQNEKSSKSKYYN